jgi:D-inositol-3-phosphate glycosyltransferase
VWAKTIGGLLHDEAERRRLAAGARAHAELFSWQRTTDQLLRTYVEARAGLASELQAVGQ